jgi:hypothetical protein
MHFPGYRSPTRAPFLDRVAIAPVPAPFGTSAGVVDPSGHLDP